MSEMKKYVKRPTVIEAVVWDETKETFEALTRMGMKYSCFSSHETENYVRDLAIKTSTGPMCANKGDVIIKGVAGEFYACRADIFALTYDPISEAS